jgi:MSP (Major sperm protein) domain
VPDYCKKLFQKKKNSFSIMLRFLRIRPSKKLTFESDEQCSGVDEMIIHQQLSLENVTSKDVAYKIKTTAPEEFCVRPSTSFVPPNETVCVQIIFKGTAQQFWSSGDVPRRFLVLAAVVPDGHGFEVGALTKLLGDAAASDDSDSLVQRIRIKVRFKRGPSSAAAAAVVARKDNVGAKIMASEPETKCDEDDVNAKAKSLKGRSDALDRRVDALAEQSAAMLTKACDFGAALADDDKGDEAPRAAIRQRVASNAQPSSLASSKAAASKEAMIELPRRVFMVLLLVIFLGGFFLGLTF